jgi:hypothetical protein
MTTNARFTNSSVPVKRVDLACGHDIDEGGISQADVVVSGLP